jgi:LuxR family transcriptional regulator, quorum-sensing system regulator BjaR1
VKPPVPDMRRSAFEFVERIERLSTTGEIMNATGELLKIYGFEHHLVSFLAIRNETLEDVLLSSQLPKEWLKVYNAKGYVHDDPGFRYAKTIVRPFRWFKEAPYDPEREPRAAEVVQLAKDFGVLDGFVVPVASTAGRMGQIWFGGRKLDLAEQQLPALHLMAIYAFDRIHKLQSSSSRRRVILTPREGEILILVANGKSNWEIGEALHIGTRTVKAHLAHVCRKFGAVTRTQAVMIAIRDKIIQT